MVSCWVSATSTVGVNVILIVQRPPPAGMDPTQLFVSAKSPLVAILVTWSGTVPAFIIVTVAGTFSEVTVLVVFSLTFPKASVCGVKATPGRLL